MNGLVEHVPLRTRHHCTMIGFIAFEYVLQGIYIIRWQLINRCARKKQFLLFNLFEAYDQIESSHESELFCPKRSIFFHACVASSELPSNTSSMITPYNDMMIYVEPSKISKHLRKKNLPLGFKGRKSSINFFAFTQSGSQQWNCFFELNIGYFEYLAVIE